jgi:hypothetical protein
MDSGKDIGKVELVVEGPTRRIVALSTCAAMETRTGWPVQLASYSTPTLWSAIIPQVMIVRKYVDAFFDVCATMDDDIGHTSHVS